MFIFFFIFAWKSVRKVSKPFRSKHLSKDGNHAESDQFL